MIAYVTLVLMNQIDWIYTHNALSMGGEEANPLMLYLFMNWGLEGIWWWKAVVLVAMIPILLIAHLEGRRYIRRFFYFSVFVYTVLTGYHVLWYSWV